jgi:hypothetical protein
MVKIQLIALVACVAVLSSIGTQTAFARQCSAARPSHPEGYWSWRLIDGRKCWYEGQPMLSKSSLEWPARAPPKREPREEVASARTEKPANLFDAQALAPDAADTFEARWRDRIEKH